MIKNATIENVRLELERDILQCWVALDFGDSTGQGFGGWALRLGDDYVRKDERCADDFCGRYLYRLLKVGGVTDFNSLKGKSVRAKTNSDRSFGGTIVALGHITKDIWLTPDELLKKDPHQ